MSDQSLKALKKAIKIAVIGQATASDQSIAVESFSSKVAAAVEQYVTDELKATGIVFEGGKLPEVITRKGNLEGIATIALTAQLAEEATNAITAGFAEAALISSSSLTANTANFATTALTASYVKLVAGPYITINTASNGNIEITGSAGGPGGDSYWTSVINSKIFTTGSADVYGSLAVTGSVISISGFSGSLTKLRDGTTNYIQAGPYITINTASNGSIQITGSVGGSSPEYWFSTTNNKTFTTGSAEVYTNLVVTGSAFITGSIIVGVGFSGSLTKLKDGTTNYLQAGPNITINTASNGSIQITGSAGGAGPQYWTSNVSGNIFATGSIDVTGSLVSSGSIKAISGFSGSLTKLKDGTDYLVAGPNITINTSSNGSIAITGSAGTAAPNVGWVTAYEVDFSTLADLNLTGSSSTVVSGVQFNVSNGGNASWIGPSASLGFVINSKATSTELWDNLRTAPLVNIVMTDLVAGYNPDDYDVRVWAQVTHNATADSENYFLGYERFPIVTPYERIYAARGYDTVQSTNLEVCYNNITAQSINVTTADELAANTQVVTLDKWVSATHYQSSGALGTFPASSSLKQLQYAQIGSFSDTRSATSFGAYPLTGSNVSVMFGAKTSNTAGTFSAVFHNLRVEYRKRGGGTFVTGSSTPAGIGIITTAKQYIAPRVSTTDTIPYVAGQFSWVPADYTGLTSLEVRAVMSTDGTANFTGSLQIYNLTSGSYLDLIDGPSKYFTITSSTPTLTTSSNLLSGITNFNNSTTSVYEVRISGSVSSTFLLGGVELVYG